MCSLFAVPAIAVVALFFFAVISGATLFTTLIIVVRYFPASILGLIIIMYFIFVRLPLQVVYRRAIKEGRFPTTQELVSALIHGTEGKAAWQSDIMAYKMNKFTATLNEETDRISRKR